MSKTLVIILSETRTSELTFDNFKKNVIDELNADLCVCIGIKPSYEYNNPFYQLAKYKFLYDEPEDFGDAFDYAFKTMSCDMPKYERLEHDTNSFHDNAWKKQVYGIKSGYDDLVMCPNIITYKKPLHWREFLKVKDQFLGGIKDAHHEHPGSGGILIFFRWFLLKKLIDNDLMNKYDRFIITRSDYVYQLPHPKMELMNENHIWFPDCEHYGGYTDRHVVLSKNNIESYLNIFNNMVFRSNEYYIKMKNKTNWNIEQLIKFNLEQNHVLHLVKEFPYVMYTIRNINGSTRWSHGIFSNSLCYYIKYHTEYDKSTDYKNKFESSTMSIDNFYKSLIY